MIKKIETIEDVLAVIDICPSLAKASIFANDDEYGFFEEIPTSLGIFYDDEKRDVFRVYTIYAEESDMTFFMKEFYEVGSGWHPLSVMTWYWGSYNNEDAINLLMKNYEHMNN